ncbi:MAG: winged helix-turn-helix transcriptional regulator, partial [Desulfurococcales archaeon]|nr:winged helix-turn-helix transcriptional regulator [Desulfurococcales archaeon]
IWKELGLQISVQAIYQHLNSLEKKGIIRPEYRMGSKVYYLTEKGARIAEILSELIKLMEG